MNIFLASAKKGARTPLYLTTSADLEGISGKYFNNCKETKTSKRSYNREEGKQLWEITERLCGLTQ